MAEKILIAYDSRLNMSLPNSGYTELFGVDESTPLSVLVNWLSQQATIYNSDFVRLRVWAHGYEPMTAPNTTTGNVDPVPQRSQGGAGIQLCKEGLTVDTVDQLQPLKGLIDWIDLQCCGAAYITPGCEGKNGDGNYFCSRLAQIVETSVKASTATLHTWFPEPDSGEVGMHIDWEGTVLTYGASGAVIKQENYP
jgi:hypothetical protein